MKKFLFVIPIIVIGLIIKFHMRDDKIICNLETKNGSMKNSINLTLSFEQEKLVNLEKSITKELTSDESLQENYNSLVKYKEENETEGVKIYITKNVNNIIQTTIIDYNLVNKDKLKNLDIDIIDNSKEKKEIKRELSKKYTCYYR